MADVEAGGPSAPLVAARLTPRGYFRREEGGVDLSFPGGVIPPLNPA